MKQYHITWFEQSGDYHSKGENFEGNEPTMAIRAFEDSHPNAIFISCVDTEAIRHNYGTQLAVQHTM